MRPDTPLILVVDDEADARSYLSELLTSEGYRVAAAESAVQALQLVSENVPDVAICDVSMPGIDGMELLSKLKLKLPGVHVILITAYVDQQTYLETFERGADDLLSKPFENEEILERVREALARKNKA